MTTQQPRTFICAYCEEEFTSTWSKIKCEEEFRHEFPEHEGEPYLVVCDGCYEIIMDIRKSQELTVH